MSVYVILHLVSESRNFQDTRGTVGFKKKREYKRNDIRKYIRDIIPEKYQEIC